MLQHGILAILPCNDIEATQAFYQRLGFTTTAGEAGFRILADGKGWRIALRPAEEGWVIPDRNSSGLYLYCEEVDSVAGRVRDIIIEEGAPHRKPWGMYEFAVSDPDGVLVRVGRPVRESDPLDH
ncbi:MAG TPA: VOC family protein [Allosphingosinicella sp.]|jgi:catechol 2,3-dioxygenase-like lactoylglutathione lyase family enzyme